MFQDTTTVPVSLSATDTADNTKYHHSRHGNRSAAGVDPRRGCGAATDGALTDVPLDVRAATGVHSTSLTTDPHGVSSRFSWPNKGQEMSVGSFAPLASSR